MPDPLPVHPRGSRARVLLSSVFGPYARDDAYGSRKINPMELYQNQVTREQGGFSLRMFHRSFGLVLIQANIDAPCTLLDFPSQARFVAEIRDNDYDIVAISAIIPNVGKVRRMCALVRRYRPQATIVVGGHIASLENLAARVDADHIVKGEGIGWLRRFLGQDPDTSIRHPAVYSGFGSRALGLTLRDKPGDTAAILIPSVGCPVGCNFCSTSALFGGKGKFVNFFETGDALFEVMCQLERNLKVQSFFVLDENFLLHRKRALELLERMEQSGKSWALYVFSSARVLKSYTIDQLVRLGISWVWMGLEGAQSTYRKLKEVDTYSLVKQLQAHGIRVLGSSIIGLETHTPENMAGIIAHAVGHDTDFHQFMLYTPNPGTPLYAQHQRDGSLYPESEFSPADAHGQFRFNYRHRHLPAGREETYLREAFQRDFEVNGPSPARIVRTFLQGWLRYRHHPDRRIRNRFRREARDYRTTHPGALWAMRRWYGANPPMAAKMDHLLRKLYRAFGWQARVTAPLLGRYIFSALQKEEKRLVAGWSYEPGAFYEKNEAALALEKGSVAACGPAQAASPGVTDAPVSALGH